MFKDCFKMAFGITLGITAAKALVSTAGGIIVKVSNVVTSEEE